MQNRKIIITLAVLLTFGTFGVTFAAPLWTFQTSLLPQTDNAFDLGTTTGKVNSGVWRNLYVSQICLSTDCKSAWPAGGSGSPGGSSGQIQYNGSGSFAGVSTSTLSAGTGVTFTGTPGYLIGGTNLTINATGGSGSGNVSTSSTETANRLPFWTTTGATPALLSGGMAGFTINPTNGLLTAPAALFTFATTTNFLATGSSTLQNFTGVNATTTNFFSTTASSTNLFGQLINGFGLSSCAGTNAVTWSGGSFSCAAQPQGTVTAVSVASANGFAGSSSGGATPSLTLTTTINSAVLKGNGTAISGAANGTDYTLVTAQSCSAGNHLSAITAAGVATCSADSGGGGGTNTDKLATSTGAYVALVANGGNNVGFGLGTSTPAWTLQLASSTRAQLALSDGSLTSNHWVFRNAGGLLYVATSSPTTLATSTVSAFSIDANGFPAFPALTSGRVPFVTAGGQLTDSANLTFNNGGGQLVVSTNVTVGSASLTTNTLTVNSAGSAVITNGNAGAGSFLSLRNSAPDGGVNIVPRSPNVETARFAASGNIGFGTTSPQYLFHLATSTRPQLVLSDSGATASNNWFFRNATGNLYIGTSSPTTFATSSVSALTIDTNGKVTANCFTNDGSTCITGGGGSANTTNTTSAEMTCDTPEATSTRFFMGGAWIAPVVASNTPMLAFSAPTFGAATSSAITCTWNVPLDLAATPAAFVMPVYVSTSTNKVGVMDIDGIDISDTGGLYDPIADSFTNVIAASTTAAQRIATPVAPKTATTSQYSLSGIPITAGHTLYLRFTRWGGAAADTVKGDLYMPHVKIKYDHNVN